jgi:hypothetical protein
MWINDRSYFHVECRICCSTVIIRGFFVPCFWVSLYLLLGFFSFVFGVLAPCFWFLSPLFLGFFVYCFWFFCTLSLGFLVRCLWVS